MTTDAEKDECKHEDATTRWTYGWDAEPVSAASWCRDCDLYRVYNAETQTFEEVKK